MKHLFLILALACSSVFAQTSTSEWHLLDPTGKDIGTYSTQSNCDAAARAKTPDNTTVRYGCPRILKVVGKVGAVVTPPVTSLMPVVDMAKLMTPAAGFSTERRQPAPGPFGPGDSQAPNPSDIGAVRMGCTASHMNKDDPIIYPGQPGLSHLHVYFGNTSANAATTQASLASGNSTCAGGKLNLSAYWAPAVIDTTDGAPVVPSGFLVYYKTGYGGVKPANVKAVPAGLRIISGSSAGNPSAPSGAGRYACVGGPDGTPGVGWQKTIPSTCTTGQKMIMEVSFPQCWDGVNLDSPDHKGHLAGTTGSGCPSTHPVALPAISYEIYYDVPKTASSMAKWRLSSDNYASTSPGGYSAHGDYLFAWDEDVMNTFITKCDNTSYDCHTNLLGDGTWLY